MCLSFQLAENAKIVEASHRAHAHEDTISCNNSTLHIHEKSDGEKIVIQSIPVSGTPSVFFPINPKFVKKIIPCGELPCQAPNLDAIINPFKYVIYSEQTRPVYRSLHTKSDFNSLRIAPLKIIINPDGGVIAIIPVGKYIKPGITQEERASLGPKMLECIKEGLKSIGKTLKDVIGIDDEMTEFALLGFLFDAVTPDCDIIIGIMPPGKTEGTFTFCFIIEKGVNKIPILGLTHGDMKLHQDVKNTFYVTGNKPLKMTFKPDALDKEEIKKYLEKDIDLPKGISFPLKSPDNYTCDHYKSLESLLEDDYVYDGERGSDSHGNSIWEENQKTFQEKYIREYKKEISKFILETVPDKRVIWNGPGGSDGLYLVELKEHVGVIYRNTTEVHIE